MEKQKILKKLGERIKYHRKKLRISQDKLAYRCGKDGASIGRVERGEINVGIVYLAEIAEALEVTVKDLIDF